MEIGIFAKTFKRDNITDCIEAVRFHGYTTVQFNMSCAGLSPMPDSLPEGLAKKIGNALKQYHLGMAALSGTFNMIHPDKKIREKGISSIRLLIENCSDMGTGVVTICTGTRNTEDMWAPHPDNNKTEAWKDLCFSLEKILYIAEENNIIIAFEPELANVIDSAIKAKQLMADMKSRYLKVIFDPANLFEKGTQREMEKIIGEGLELLATDIIIAHAKDRTADGKFTAAGLGILPYPFFIGKLKETGFDGPVITHGLDEKQAGKCYEFLKQLIDLK